MNLKNVYAAQIPIKIEFLSVGFALVSHRKIEHGFVTDAKVHFPRRKSDQRGVVPP